MRSHLHRCIRSMLAPIPSRREFQKRNRREKYALADQSQRHPRPMPEHEKNVSRQCTLPGYEDERRMPIKCIDQTPPPNAIAPVQHRLLDRRYVRSVRAFISRDVDATIATHGENDHRGVCFHDWPMSGECECWLDHSRVVC